MRPRTSDKLCPASASRARESAKKAEDDLEDDEACIQRDADEKGPAEILGRVAVGMPSVPMVMTVMVVAVVTFMLVIVGCLLCHGRRKASKRRCVNRIDLLFSARPRI